MSDAALQDVEPKTITVQANKSEEHSHWDLIVRRAKAYSVSPLVPEHLRKTGDAVANCIVAMEMAELLNESPLVIMQHIYFVHGRPGWNATYMIARANKSGKFRDPIDWVIEGTGDNMKATAFTTLAATGRKIEFSVDMKMAKAEDWTKNSKYKSMPELMLRYRSATLLVRLYCPEVMLGMHTVDEVEDVAYSVEQVAPPPSIALQKPVLPPLEVKPETVNEDSEP